MRLEPDRDLLVRGAVREQAHVLELFDFRDARGQVDERVLGRLELVRGVQDLALTEQVQPRQFAHLDDDVLAVLSRRDDQRTRRTPTRAPLPLAHQVPASVLLPAQQFEPGRLVQIDRVVAERGEERRVVRQPRLLRTADVRRFEHGSCPVARGRPVSPVANLPGRRPHRQLRARTCRPARAVA